MKDRTKYTLEFKYNFFQRFLPYRLIRIDGDEYLISCRNNSHVGTLRIGNIQDNPKYSVYIKIKPKLASKLSYSNSEDLDIIQLFHPDYHPLRYKKSWKEYCERLYILAKRDIYPSFTNGARNDK